MYTYTIKTEIEFIAPFLFNKPEDERASGSTKTEAYYMEKGKQRVHRNGQGLYIPAWTLKVTLIEGARKTFKGKNSITDKVKALVFPEDALFGVNDYDELHICWGRVPPGPKGKMQKIYRPMMHMGRIVPVQFNVMSDTLEANKLNESWVSAGVLAAMGSWRPEYGRFIVKSWEVASYPKPSMAQSGQAQLGVVEPSGAKHSKAK